MKSVNIEFKKGPPPKYSDGDKFMTICGNAIVEIGWVESLNKFYVGTYDGYVTPAAITYYAEWVDLEALDV